MNRTHTPLSRRPVAPLAAAMAATVSLAVSGCAQDKAFTVNGQVITKDEYIKTLERQTVAAPGGGATNGIRSAIDQLVGNKVVLAEANKSNVLPSDDEVKRYYDTQKKLFAANNPSKGDYEKAMKEEGTTPEDVKAAMKIQLAESAVYAKKLGIDDNQIRDEYNKAAGRFGLPARVQLRMVLTAPGSPEFTQAKSQLSSKSADFNSVAAKINPPQLRATQGLLPQAIPSVGGMSGEIASKVQQTAEGAFFGPIDFRASPNAPNLKAWVKIEKKMPGLTIDPDAAKPLVRAQLVQQRLAQPAAQPVRDELIKQKLDATLQADDKVIAVWNALKTAAKAAGAGKAPTASLTSPAPDAGAANPIANPAGAPLTK
ncbi:MAG: SurA N-terminal domain-containing protein [Cytophagales bacterium]|nr:SurA N-terminal domain-containing protein [Armatimonadota bacterium]